MRTVRLRLLVLALVPVMLLLPLLLLLGMARWTADYDELLIAKVESDLRIAEQYLTQILVSTGDDLRSVADSVSFARALNTGEVATTAFFDQTRAELGLDFLYYLPDEDAIDAAARWPVIATALDGSSRTEIDIFPAEDLEDLADGLAERARVALIDTAAAVPTDRTEENRGMVVHAASPVRTDTARGVLIGGILLNRNLDFIDTINALVYLNAVTGGENQGTATLFLDDVRVSTNVRLFEDVRALGTRVSAAVRGAVLDEGQTWLDRAFVVNEWYISGYLPIRDSFGTRVGMLYVGFLEGPFSAAKREALIWMIAAVAGVLILSVPVFLWMARGVFAPLEKMTRTMQRVSNGNLSARNGHSQRRDEIGQVADHLDDLLDQVQDRDQKLRAWADELNTRVDQRTAELRETNAKLEETYRQLVMSEKLAAIGEITAGVAHEINNPVAVIQGNVDVMREVLGPQADPVETELDLVDQQVGRIRAIVGKLLTFARPGEFNESLTSVDLKSVIEDCLLLVDHELRKGDIAIHCDLREVPSIEAETGEIQQVIINLLVNAVQAMQGAGDLSLSLAQATQDGQAGVSFEVRDSGPGIPKDALDTVFDPFFTTKQAEGTGLGLSISQAIIQRTGGQITARNHPDGGAVFSVWIPLAEQSIAAQ
ncbi:sensor histidine kinase [Shimia ponticola]|uniref:sensor histidine kinase n=1 Tax=Shimia ponticola TaxID=2582893 RepID=UPI0011BD76F1|nr:cache domain-containing protein [Shimia ponticola]